jgi:hypothetical protein
MDLANYEFKIVSRDYTYSLICINWAGFSRHSSLLMQGLLVRLEISLKRSNELERKRWNTERGAREEAKIGENKNFQIGFACYRTGSVINT